MKRPWLVDPPIEVEAFRRCACGEHPHVEALSSASRDPLETRLTLKLSNRTTSIISLAEARIRNHRKNSIQLVAEVSYARYENTYDMFEMDFGDDLSGDDRERLSALIAAIAGTGVGEAATSPDERLQADQVAILQAVLDNGFAQLSEQGQERLGPIQELLNQQLGDMASGNINPFAISQYWTHQFDNYKDWEFARLARTESAFAQMTAKTEWLRAEFDADDSAINELNAIPPIHPNCMCDLQPMVIGNHVYMYLDTQLEPCVLCNDLADQVLDLIESMPIGDPVDSSPEDVDDYLSNLSHEDYDAVANYCGGDYHAMNEALLRGGTSDERIAQQIEQVQRVLEEAPKYGEGKTVYRSMYNLSKQDFGHLLREKNEYINQPGFCSTSSNEKLVREHLENNLDLDHRNVVIMHIEQTTGVDISSVNAKQAEVLIPPGASFQIKSRSLEEFTVNWEDTSRTFPCLVIHAKEIRSDGYGG